MVAPIILETLRISESYTPGFFSVIHKNELANTSTSAKLTMKQILIAYPWFSDELKQKLLEYQPK